MRIGVIIPAAGGATRYLSSGGARHKLEEDLAGRTVLLRAVEAFTLRDEVETIVVVGPEGDDDFDTFKLRQGDQLAFHGVIVGRGGPTRTDSVRNALSLLPEAVTHVAVHDGARPLVSELLLDRVFDAARNHAAVIPAVPVGDTIKRIRAGAGPQEQDPLDAILGDAGKTNASLEEVAQTLPRDDLVAVQTPQVFERSLLERAYASVGVGTTDDAAMVEALGEPVIVVQGEPSNIKITAAGDLVVARAVLGGGAVAKRPAHKRF